MQLDISQLKISPKEESDQATEKYKQLPVDEQAELIKAFDAIDLFAREMKLRFIQKHLEGNRGWSNNTMDVVKEIVDRAERLQAGEQKADIGIANWAFINWFNRVK
jgi:hypothetical protein